MDKRPPQRLGFHVGGVVPDAHSILPNFASAIMRAHIPRQTPITRAESRRSEHLTQRLEAKARGPKQEGLAHLFSKLPPFGLARLTPDAGNVPPLGPGEGRQEDGRLIGLDLSPLLNVLGNRDANAIRN